ncbi:hypothetical protein D3C73_1034550 [compost metagenome]
MHQSQRQRCICTRVERQEPVSPLGCPVAVHINDHYLRAALTCLLREHNLMHVGAYNVAAPDDNQVGIYRILRAGASIHPHGVHPSSRAGRAADFGIQPAGPQRIKEAAVHAAHAEHAHIAVEIVREDALRPVFL